MRDFFCKVSPDSLRPLLHQLTRDAYRRKALAPDRLPFGVVALDGKVTGVGRTTDDSGLGQSVTVEEGKKDRTLIRSITACLVSAAARIVIDVTFLPAKKNEMSHFNTAFDELNKVYGRSDLFQVVTYDAGATSKANAQHVVDAGKDYVLALKTPQHELWNEYVPELEQRGASQADGETVDNVSSNKPAKRVWEGAPRRSRAARGRVWDRLSGNRAVQRGRPPHRAHPRQCIAVRHRAAPSVASSAPRPCSASSRSSARSASSPTRTVTCPGVSSSIGPSERSFPRPHHSSTDSVDVERCLSPRADSAGYSASASHSWSALFVEPCPPAELT